MATGKNINELTQNTELDDSDLLLVGNKGTGSLRQITVEDAENSALGYDSGDDTSPTAWENVDKIESSEKAPSLFKKLTTMAKNVRWLFSKMGTTDISSLGDGTVTGAINELNNGIQANTDLIDSVLSDYARTITLEDSDVASRLLEFPGYTVNVLCATGNATFTLTNGATETTGRGVFTSYPSSNIADFTLFISSTRNCYFGRINKDNSLVNLYQLQGTSVL